MSAASTSTTIPVVTHGITASPILGSAALCLNIPIGPVSVSLCV